MATEQNAPIRRVARRAEVRRMAAWRPFADTGRTGEPRRRPAAHGVRAVGRRATRAWPRSGCSGRVLERGIVPDVVIGTSAGALNGAAVAYSPNLTGVAQLDAVWTSLTRRPTCSRAAG